VTGVVAGRREGSMDDADDRADMRLGKGLRFAAGKEGSSLCSEMIGKVVSPATDGVL
jgi:hypothetical protein